MSAITAKASRKMKKYAVLTREPRCFLGSFDFSWEQRKLVELVDVCSGRDYKHLSEGTIPVYGTGGYMLSVNDALSYDRDAIGIGRKGTIDRPYILKAPFWTVDTLFYAIPREKVDLNFAFDIFQNIDWKKKDESTGVPSLSKTAINDIDVLAPKHGEQQTIGQFFAAIDHLITLHQRKCALLFSPFQAFISMMFTTSTFSWEQRKLSEMCGTFEYGLNAAAKEFDGKNKYIRITDIDDASREFLLSDLSSPDICLDGMSKYLLSSGDIVFARTGASVGKTYIYRENDGIVYFAGFLIRAKVNQDNDAEFVFQSTLSPSYEKYIRITSQRSGQPGVNAQEYGEYDLFAPSKEEQQRIGHFLRGIANLITLHQRKCIFFTGRAGRLISTVNKKRITSSWEQRKLGDVVQITMGQSPDGSTYSDEPSDYILVQGNADLQNGWVCPRIWTTQITKKADAGDLIMSVRAPAGAMGKTAYNAVIGRGVAAIKGNEFIYQLLVKMDTDGFWKTLSCGSTFESLNSDNIKNAEVKIPTTAEQKKIGGLFQYLDNLITLHQRKPFLMKWRTSDANRNQTNRLVL